MSSNDWSELRHLCSIKPTGWTWEQLIKLLGRWVPEEEELALEYALKNVNHWPDTMKMDTFLSFFDSRSRLLPPSSKFLGYTEIREQFDEGFGTKSESHFFYFNQGECFYEWVVSRCINDHDECHDFECGTFTVLGEKRLLLTPTSHEENRYVPVESSFWPAFEKNEKPYTFDFEVTKEGFLVPSMFLLYPQPFHSVRWEKIKDYFYSYIGINRDESEYIDYEYIPVSSSTFCDYVSESEYYRKGYEPTS